MAAQAAQFRLLSGSVTDDTLLHIARFLRNAADLPTLRLTPCGTL